MTDFFLSWNLSRQRFVDEVSGLRDEQLRWKAYDGSLSIGEMAVHVAGVEVSFASQIRGKTLGPDEQRLKSAATEGVVNQNPFPYSISEITSALVERAFAAGKEAIEPLMNEPSPADLQAQLKSALGPMISGEGALARLAFHPAYHQGQAYLLKNDPRFPS